jgi:thiopurine S-methyltransferase
MSQLTKDEKAQHERLNSQWHERWENNLIGFHVGEVQPWLVEHWPRLSGQTQGNNACVFVPLCGKTLDIEYFLNEGYQVVACELSEMAVQQLFVQLAIKPDIKTWQGGLIYSGPNLNVYVGDMFGLGEYELAGMDYIYDRAALIALPKDTRRDYMAKLKALCPKAKQFIITLDYDQNITQGPPYAVSQQEIHEQYADRFQVQRILHEDVIEDEPRFKKRGLQSLHESLYWLEPVTS